MTRSIRRLFRIQSTRILWSTAAVVVVFLITGMVTSPAPTPCCWLPLGLSALMVIVTDTGTGVRRTMFPISDREQAWAPLALAGAWAVSGAIGIALLQLLHTSSIAVFAQGWASVLAQWPLACFVILLGWRITRINASYVAFFLLFGVQIRTQILLLMPVFQHPLTPFVSALGCAFLVLEAPHQVAVVSRLGSVRAENTGGIMRQNLDFNAARRVHWSVRVADALLFGVVTIGAVSFFLSWHKTRPLTATALAAWGTFGVVRSFWKSARASGLSRSRSVAVSLLQLTGVGYALREIFGVTNGEPVKCTECHHWRMPWQLSCPHRQHSFESPQRQPIDEPQKRPRWLTFTAGLDPAAVLYRFLIPVYMLLFMWLFRR